MCVLGRHKWWGFQGKKKLSPSFEPVTPFFPDPGEGWSLWKLYIRCPDSPVGGPWVQAAVRGAREKGMSGWKGTERVVTNLCWVSEDGCPCGLRDEVVHSSSRTVIIALLIAPLPQGTLWQRPGYKRPATPVWVMRQPKLMQGCLNRTQRRRNGFLCFPSLSPV